MKHFSYALFLLTVILMVSTAQAAQDGSYPEAGDPFPDLSLQGEISTSQKEYLGLENDKSPALADIDADVVLIEIFSMYCPFCQREAPAVNELYEMMQSAELGKEVKVIGIGVGNTQFEVDFFRDKYDIPFPLFSDQDYTVIDRTGQVGTPYFVLIRLSEEGPHHTLLSHVGPFDSPESFLEEVRSALRPDASPGK